MAIRGGVGAVDDDVVVAGWMWRNVRKMSDR